MNSLLKLIFVAWFCCGILTNIALGQCSEIISNGNFTSTTIDPAHDEFCKTWVTNWQSSHGSPQIGTTLPHSSPYYASMWGENTWGEGIMTDVSISNGHKYVLTYWYRKPTSGSPDIDNFYVRLGPTGMGTPCSSGGAIPSPTPVQTVDLQNNISNTDWLKRQICFTANNNYQKIYLYPQSNTTTAEWIDIDDVSLVEMVADAGDDITSCSPVEIGPTCNIPGTTYSWSPSTGLSSTTARNPTVTPSGSHTYTLTITGPGGCQVTDQVTVSTVCCLTAGFEASSVPLCGIGFANTSTIDGGRIVSYFWDFGDGSTSTSANPTHYYNYGGTYTVCLTVIATNGLECCTQKYCAPVVNYPCDPMQCNITPDFSWYQVDECNYVYRFTATGGTSSPTPTGWYWDFGDGTTATGQVVNHTFPGPTTGIPYNVCVTGVAALIPSGCCTGRHCEGVAIPECAGGGGGHDKVNNKKLTGLEPTLNVYPNPSKGSVTLEYQVAEDGDVSVTLYNIQGQVIKNVVSPASHKAGMYSVQLTQEGIAPGTYICRVQISDANYTEKIIIIK